MSESKSDEPLPSPADLRGAVGTAPSESQSAEKAFRRRSDKRSIEAEEDYLHLTGLRSHYRHKNGWSWFTGGIIAIMLLFQFYLLRKVGQGDWDFTKYAFLLPALMVQNLGQVIALALVIVRNLFPNNGGK